ncbi:MAG: hypothetical protein R3D26_02695 [Cyanobacteriota/Melainabacteria group bacterium]
MSDAGADYIWLLNNDATVEPATLSALVDAAEGDTAAGAVSACIVERDKENGKIVKRVGRGVLDIFNAKAHLRAPDSEEVKECDWISGSNMLLRADALRQTEPSMTTISSISRMSRSALGERARLEVSTGSFCFD